MQLVLGVSVAARTARLALVDTSAPDTVIDQFDLDLASAPPDTLRSTIVGTDRSLSDSGHTLGGTRISSSDEDQAAELRDALTDAGLTGVAVVSPADAATALVRRAATKSGHRTSALLFVDESTAALSVVGADADTTSVVAIEPVGSGGPEAACTELLGRLREETGGAEGLYLVGPSEDTAALTRVISPASPVPVQAVESPAFAIARGATLARATSGWDTASNPSSGFGTAPGPQIGEHLAYSMDPDSGASVIGYGGDHDGYGADVPMQASMAPLSHTDDPDEVEDDIAPAGTGGRPRILLVGSTIAAIVVVGFAALAVGVAISIKPELTAQAIRDYESVPGKYLPTMPGQGTVPVEDPAVFLPPVVPVEEKPAETGSGKTVLAGGNRGRYSTSAGFGGEPGGTRTVFITPGAGGPGGGGGVVSVPPANAFKLSDWLPSGMNINVGQLFSKTERCKPGDVRCVYTATGGCLPGSGGFDKCIEDRFGCPQWLKGCVKTESVTVADDCSKVTTGLCQKPVVTANSATTETDILETSCPTGATCVPLVADNNKDNAELPSSSSSDEPGTESRTGPDGPTTVVLRPDQETPPSPPIGPVTPPSSDPALGPSDSSTPPSESAPDQESVTPKPPFRRADPPSAEEAPVPPPPPVEAPAPVEAPPPAPPAVVDEPTRRPIFQRPAPQPVIEQAPAPPVVEQAPAAPAAPPPPPAAPERPRLELPKLRDIFGGGGGRRGGGGSDSAPETTIVEAP